MPVLSPSGVLQFFIDDLVNEVLLRTENRTTDTARARIWLRDALLEITANPVLRDEFDELEVLGPLFNLTGGASILAGSIQEYAFSNIVPAGDYNIATLDVLLWTDPPTNSNRIKLEETHYQASDKVNPFTGQPAEWYRFADTIGFVPAPQLAYQVQARIYIQHPINDNLPGQTLILINRDWNEILIWEAVRRGFAELKQYETAQEIYMMLHGDPNDSSKPGLLYGRKKRRAKESFRDSVPLRVKKRAYGYGRKF